MGDIAELAKIEKRRARRQRRILESAESRLDKITCSQSALRQHTDATPVTTPPLTEKMTLAEHYPAPTDRRREKYEQSLSSTSSPILSERQLKKHRPAVRKLIEEEQANQLKERGFLGGYIPQSLIVTMLHRTSSQPKRSKHPANKYWHLMHMLCMMWLGSLAIFEAMSKQGLQQVSQWMLSNDTSASAPSTSSALYFVSHLCMETLITWRLTVFGS
ncbi:hypothetical protein BDF20DRAFT_838857 [Mycotypha africana]|uniref:uncharacterized protein n=1 Tax=Mycotypha africana TaxID=64632 RepID=UPI0023004DF0|nr:uncharacterized protein BDF20DRAFT_838857 [Mycotypha africana]KAI8968859.1 hypothetical protein BDF20DRAFT_838857 [Mycotypha africana]